MHTYEYLSWRYVGHLAHGGGGRLGLVSVSPSSPCNIASAVAGTAFRLTTTNTGAIAATGAVLRGLLGGSALVAIAASTTVSECY